MLDSIFLKNKLKTFLQNNSNRKKVVFITDHKKIKALADVIKSCLSYFGSNTIIICFQSRIPEEFNSFINIVKISEDYLAYKDYLEIDKYVFKDISKNWDEEVAKIYKNIFIYRNVELAKIAEYNFQLFLLVKIKALIVMNRAIKKENYKAAFIIDSNNELSHLDELLQRKYHISTDLVSLKKKESFIDIIRRIISSWILCSLDNTASLFIRKQKQAKLIDARLYYQLNPKNKSNFILAPFERGVRLRLKCLFKNTGYIAFTLGNKKLRKSNILPKKTETIDVKFLKKKFTFKDINYWELVEDKIGTLIGCDFARYRKNIDVLFNTQNTHQIKSIILRNDVKELEKTIVVSSKKMNASTLVIQHGMLAEPNGHDIIYADKVAVWGPYAALWYKQFGNDINKITIVGNPNFDEICEYKNLGNDDDDFFKKLDLNKKRRLVTLIAPCTDVLKFSSFVTDDITRCLIRDVVKAIKSIGNLNLVVKLHPNDNLRSFAQLITRKDRSFMCIIDKTDLHELIKFSDLIITRDSTVALEAILMRKPIVIINLNKRPDLVPYVAKNVALGAYYNEDIISVINKALNDEEAKRKMDIAREDFISNFLYRTDSKSKERSLQLIENY